MVFRVTPEILDSVYTVICRILTAVDLEITGMYFSLSFFVRRHLSYLWMKRQYNEYMCLSIFFTSWTRTMPERISTIKGMPRLRRGCRYRRYNRWKMELRSGKNFTTFSLNSFIPPLLPAEPGQCRKESVPCLSPS